MVKGMDKFHEYFAEYSDQYVLIGGAACDISFHANEADFRATRDLDIVLIVEALTVEFAQRFWEFIREGKYRNRAKSNGCPQFYRFDKPEESTFPAMIELFSRKRINFSGFLAPIHIDDSVSSLSAILLDDAYYELLMECRDVIEGISVLRPSGLILFKAKAWLDLTKKMEQGMRVDSRDIKKHRNDVIRICADLAPEPYELKDSVKEDMELFLQKLQITDADLKNLGLAGMHESDIQRILKSIYQL